MGRNRIKVFSGLGGPIGTSESFHVQRLVLQSQRHGREHSHALGSRSCGIFLSVTLTYRFPNVLRGMELIAT